MNRFRYRFSSLGKFVRKRQGQVLIEYGFVLILIAVVVIAAIVFVGNKTNNMYSTVGSTLPQPQ